MGEHGRGPRLSPEPIDELLVPGERAVEDLDRHLTREHGVLRAEDLTHPAGGDPLQHVVAAVERDESRVSGGAGSRGLCDALGRS